MKNSCWGDCDGLWRVWGRGVEGKQKQRPPTTPASHSPSDRPSRPVTSVITTPGAADGFLHSALSVLSNNLRPDYKCLYYPSARQTTRGYYHFHRLIIYFTVSTPTMYSRYHLGRQKRCPTDVRFLIKVPNMHHKLTTPAQYNYPSYFLSFPDVIHCYLTVVRIVYCLKLDRRNGQSVNACRKING